MAKSVIRLISFMCVAALTMCTLSKNDKIVIDNDAGGDDSIAIFLAILFEEHFDGPEIVALTTGNGNTNEDNVCTNNQRILKIIKRDYEPYSIPIFRGAKRSLVTTPLAVGHYGDDGLGDSDDVYHDLVEPQKQPAALALIDLSKKYRGQLTLVTIGTLTNVALAISLDPSFLGRLKHLYIGAGHIHDENYPTPEFNAHMDVEAYHIIAQNATPDQVTILPFSQVKTDLNFTKEWREKVLGAMNTDIVRAINKFEKVSLTRGPAWTALDPAVVAAVLNPDLVEQYKYSKNDIIMCGKDRGLVTNTFVDNEADANVRVIYKLKHDQFKRFYINVFSKQLLDKKRDTLKEDP